MRIGSTSLLKASVLVALGLGGVLACGSSDAQSGPGPSAGSPGTAGSVGTAGAAGSPSAGASGALSAGAPGASGAGGAVSGGAGGASAGAAGASGGAGGASGGAGGGGASGGSASGGMGGGGGAAPFALSSPSLLNKEGCGTANIPACDEFATDFLLPTIGGANHSPELDWTPGPAGTLSYAIVLYDESNKYTHWAIWNIPVATNKLPASLAAGSDPNGITGAKQLSFYMSKNAYAGPGAKAHVYQFKLYALKVASISPTTTGTDAQIAVRTLLEASTDVLAKVELVGASPQ